MSREGRHFTRYVRNDCHCPLFSNARSKAHTGTMDLSSQTWAFVRGAEVFQLTQPHHRLSLPGVLFGSHTDKCIKETGIYSKFLLNPDHFLPFTEVDRYEDTVRYLMGDYKELIQSSFSVKSVEFLFLHFCHIINFIFKPAF